MNRTQNSPKRRQEKHLSARRKHWNRMQVTDRPSPDAPSLTQAIIVQMVYLYSTKQSLITHHRNFVKLQYRNTPQISTPPKITTPSVFTEIYCRLQCPESTYLPIISTPVSWKYVHNRWNMHNSVLCAESTGLNRLLPCRIFHSVLSYPPPPPPPPKVSTAPKISTCSVANPENTYVLIYNNGVLR